MLVFNIQHFSTHDGPGIRTVIFLKGCPLRCGWCHNPEGQGFSPEISFDAGRCTGCGSCAAVCPAGAHLFPDGVHRFDREKCAVCGLCAEGCPVQALELIGRTYTVEELLREVGKDAVFYGAEGGVTLSGGEPFARPEETLELLAALKGHGYRTAVETSGCVPPDRLRQAAPYTDLFLYDCKLTDDRLHRLHTGTGCAEILSNLRVLDGAGAKVILRCPVIPGVNDTPEHMEAAAALAEEHPCVAAVELEPYHPLGIRKYAALGRTPGYGNPNKLPAEGLTELLALLQGRTRKPARISK